MSHSKHGAHLSAATIPSTTPSINLQEAITRAESVVNGTYNQHPATLEFVAKQDNSVALAHVLQIENEHTGAWVEAFVDAHSGDVVHMTDFVAKSSVCSLTSASRLSLPIDSVYSIEHSILRNNILPKGSIPYLILKTCFRLASVGTMTVEPPRPSQRMFWLVNIHSKLRLTLRSGNNAVAYGGPQSLTTSQSSPILNFIYPQNPNQQPTTQANLDAARTNAFYVANVVHDFSYKYGFTEEGRILFSTSDETVLTPFRSVQFSK